MWFHFAIILSYICCINPLKLTEIIVAFCHVNMNGCDTLLMHHTTIWVGDG